MKFSAHVLAPFRCDGCGHELRRLTLADVRPDGTIDLMTAERPDAEMFCNDCLSARNRAALTALREKRDLARARARWVSAARGLTRKGKR